LQSEGLLCPKQEKTRLGRVGRKGKAMKETKNPRNIGNTGGVMGECNWRPEVDPTKGKGEMRTQQPSVMEKWKETEPPRTLTS